MKKLKQKAARGILRITAVVTGILQMVFSETMAVFAAGEGEGNGGITLQGGDGSDIIANVTAPMMTLVKAILSVMSVVGVIMLVKAVMDLVNTMGENSPGTVYHAGKSIAVALLMVAIYPVVSLFIDLG